MSAYLALGYRPMARSANSVELVLPRSFSLGWAAVWFLLFGVGELVYLSYYYLFKKERTAYLLVGDDGQVFRSFDRPPRLTL